MKAADWILARPWAITEEALGVILAIAERRNDSPQAVEARLGRPLDNAHSVSVRDGVAIVPVVGPISRYADFFTEVSGATSIEALARDFRAALDDRSIRAIVLNVDSPGGTVSGVSEFASHVRAARGTKPIVAYVGSQAASAGYWIASAADSIVADSTAMLGSIGVVMGMPRKKPTDPIEIVSSQSPFKRVDVGTEAGKAQVQATADDLADLFVDAVADHRGVTREAVLSDFGRGGCLVASRAVAAGMADAVGSLEGVIASLSRGESPPARPQPRPQTPPQAQPNPREPAMSEPQTPPVAGDHADILARLDAAERRAEAEARSRQEAEARAGAAVERAIEADANAFLADHVGRATATAFSARLREAFVMAARDDHAHPVAGSPAARQDALRAALKALPPGDFARERASSDPADRTRALGSDPADEDPRNRDAEAAELDRIDAETRKFASGLNGKRK